MAGFEKLSDNEFKEQARRNLRLAIVAYTLYRSAKLTQSSNVLTLLEHNISQLKWTSTIDELDNEFRRRGLSDDKLCDFYRNLIGRVKGILRVFSIDEQLLIWSEKPLVKSGLAFKNHKGIDFVCWDSTRETLRPLRFSESEYRAKISEVNDQGITNQSLTENLEKSDEWDAYKTTCEEIIKSFGNE